MKKLFLLSIFLVFIGFQGYSQFAFGVAPSLTMNTAYFGFKAGPVVPYAGFMFANVGVKMDYRDRYYDGIEWQTDEYDMKIGGNLYIPTIGVKFFAVEMNQLKAFFNLSVSKPLVRGKMEYDGTEEEEFAETLKEIKVLGAALGFGVEYFFDDNFSLGGEYGLQYIGGKYTDVYEYMSGGEPAEQETTYKVRVAPTFAKISLNFYFGGGSGE